ncbi:lasso RiPP family leader peptide-containing protein [Erythrobacter sp. MTPC3]
MTDMHKTQKSYATPQLTSYGSVRNLTGGSVGDIGDGSASRRMRGTMIGG